MNIWGRSKSNWTAQIFISSWPKPMNITLYSLVSGPTNIISIYLLVPMNEHLFLVVSGRSDA
jgi:hypothetical protein